MKNILVAQSGGPTAAINATLAGVIREAKKQREIDRIYGAFHGVQGILADEIAALEWINETGNGVTEEMLQYLRPLVQGELLCEYENGIPKFFVIPKDQP